MQLRSKVDELKETAINGSLKASADERGGSSGGDEGRGVKSLDEVAGSSARCRSTSASPGYSCWWGRR